MQKRSYRCVLLATAALVGMGLVLGPAWSDGTPSPPPPSDAPKPSDTKATKPKATKKKKQSDNQFFEGYRHAYNLVQDGRYQEAIAAFHALDQDDHPDVANYIGYASRKLGRYDDAKTWYERALTADANHARTWQYYGMWHLEQGNRLKAEDHLAKIQSICGTSCKEYASLKEALNGNMVY